MIMPLRSPRAVISAFALLVLLAGCSGSGMIGDSQRAYQRIDAYLAAHPGLEAATASAIRQARVRTGMTPPQVIAAWGRPVSVQKYRGGSQQFWLFGCTWPHRCDYPDSRHAMMAEIHLSQVLFENGRVIEHQN